MKPRRGRPPLDHAAASEPVCVKLSARTYDRLYEQATRDHTTIPEIIRRTLERDLDIQNRQRD